MECDIKQLVTGIIPSKVLHNALSAALISTSAEADKEYDVTGELKYRDIANKLWNPFTSSLISVSVTNAVTENVATPPSAPPHDTKKVKRLVDKPGDEGQPVSELSAKQISSINTALVDILGTRKRVFRTPGHPHIKCDKLRCTFCVALFERTTLTKCVGHKPCCKVGWYPHVGTGLWSMIKSRHNTGKPCTLKPKKCGMYDLPALLEARTTETPSASEVEVTELEYPAELDTGDVMDISTNFSPSKINDWISKQKSFSAAVQSKMSSEQKKRKLTPETVS